MRIAIQKQTQTQEEKNANQPGEELIISQQEFETLPEAQQFFYNAKIKYGEIMNKDYFGPEQGSAKFNTETKQEGNKFITYYYFLNGFEGNIIKMMNSTKTARRISKADAGNHVKLSVIDYFGDLNIDALYSIDQFNALAKDTQDKLINYYTTAKENNTSPAEAKAAFMTILNNDTHAKREEEGQMRLFSSRGISTRDVRAGIDYSKVAERDLEALESVTKRFQEYFLSGREDTKELEDFRSRIMDLTLDLNEVIAALQKQQNIDLIPEGSRKRIGLNRNSGGSFNNWLDTFIDEKGIDLEDTFEVEGPEYGINTIPYGVIIEHMKIAQPHEQAAIKNMLVRLDFANADIRDYLRHLGKAIAK